MRERHQFPSLVGLWLAGELTTITIGETRKPNLEMRLARKGVKRDVPFDSRSAPICL